MKKMTNKFYDTCSLIFNRQNLFSNKKESFIISSITLEELENIKQSHFKDIDIKIAVQQLLHKLDKHIGEYEVCVFKEYMLNPIQAEDLPINNDMKILATAIYYNQLNPNMIFITNDLSLKTLARLFFDDTQIDSIQEESEYNGYKIYQFKDEKEIEYFYSNYLTDKIFDDININEYLILKNPEAEIIDRLVYTETGYRNISFETFDSKELGRVRPLDIQ